MPYFLNPNIEGLISVQSNLDGYSITLNWATAYPKNTANSIAYNIYMDTEISPYFPSDFFNQSLSFIITDKTNTAIVQDLNPGTLYHFAVRAAEYNKSTFDLTKLPIAYNNLRTLPKSLLQSNITLTDTVISLIDTSEFPSSGTIKLGSELIAYSSILGNDLIVSERGSNNSTARPHRTDGYDGSLFWDPNAIFWPYEIEEQNTRVFECQNRFDIPNWSYTTADGYHQKLADLLNTDLTVSDQINQNFPSFDYVGYHRTNPVDILSGKCIGSYIGGYRGCASDGYGNNFQIRGVSVQDVNLQRQEILLNVDGEPVIFMKRQWTGLTCSCFIPSQEAPEARCTKCFGTGFVVGYQQYFNPRRSDGKIMVRFDPTVETVDPTDSGLESTLKPNCWTLTVPSIHERDFMVRFDQAGNEEFRYEILNVTRNKFVLDFEGMQRFTAQRIRKTDIIYQVRCFGPFATNPDGSSGINTPTTVYTSINSSAGFPPHSHNIIISSSIVSPLQINGITSINYGHSHAIENGIIKLNQDTLGPSVGHDHTIIFP